MAPGLHWVGDLALWSTIAGLLFKASKYDPECTKTHHFQIKNQKNSGEGRPCKSPPYWRGSLLSQPQSTRHLCRFTPWIVMERLGF